MSSSKAFKELDLSGVIDIVESDAENQLVIGVLALWSF
jgi:hypothetical protein